MKAGETHSYGIILRTGQFGDATANQQKITLLVSIFAPNGDTLTTINSQVEDIPITFQAKAAGNYRIEVFPYNKGTTPGKYEIKINEVLSADAYAKRLSDLQQKQQTATSCAMEYAGGAGYDKLGTEIQSRCSSYQ